MRLHAIVCALVSTVLLSVLSGCHETYILHALHVMHEVARVAEGNRYMDRAQSEAATCAAVLHDVIEDSRSPRIQSEVYEIAGDRAGDAVLLLTRSPHMSWDSYIERVCGDWIARLVKVVDLKHNQQLSRLGREPTETDLKNFRRYVAARHLIETFRIEPGEREG